MARQLVFTSAPRGLQPGRTGLVTVARHRDLDEALVARLERWSVYDRGKFGAGRCPEVFALRWWGRGGVRWFVLTRLVDAGTDYSGRANHLAHHLIVGEQEVEQAPDPATLALGWEGWLERWEGGPRWLEAEDVVDLGAVRLRKVPRPGGPVEAWVEEGRAVAGEAIYPVGEERGWVAAVGEALRRVEGRCWEVTWTSVSSPQDGTGFVWRGVPGEGWRFRPDPVGQEIRVTEGKRGVRGEVKKGGTGDAEPGRVVGGHVSRTDPLGGGWRWERRWVVGGLGGAGLAVLGWVAWSLARGGEGDRWVEETRALMREGNRAAVEDRVRLAERGGGVPKGAEGVWQEAGVWVAGERMRERLMALQRAGDEEGLVRALQGLDGEPKAGEWRRLVPELRRAEEEGRRWLAERQAWRLRAEGAVEKAEGLRGAAREAARVEARILVESLGGEAGARLRERLEAMGREEAMGVEEGREQVEPEAREGVERQRVVSPVNGDGSVIWEGGGLSRRVAQQLLAGEGTAGITVGRLWKEGGEGEREEGLEVVRGSSDVKVYRGMDLLVEIRRTVGGGLSWRPSGVWLGEGAAGWWLRVGGEEGLEVRFFRPGLARPMRVGLTDLMVDSAGGRSWVRLGVVRLQELIPMVRGLAAMLEVRVDRGGREVVLRSAALGLGEGREKEGLSVELRAGDEVRGGRLWVRDPSGEGAGAWELVEFGEGR